LLPDNICALTASTASLVLKSLLGVLLLVLAVRTYFGEDDPDAPHPKWMTALDKASPITLFGIALLLSLIQLRFVVLMMAGINSIVVVNLSASQVVISLAILILAVIWPQLLPILIYLIMGQKAQLTLNSMNNWLTRNQRIVNVIVLGLFGIILLADGLSGIFSSG
jgi:hypothetical protein